MRSFSAADHCACRLADNTLTMAKACRIVIWLFALAYLGATIVFAVGASGLFGVDRDPLAAVYLIPIGLPWNLAVDWIPVSTQTTLAILAPAINLFLVAAACRWLRGAR